MYTHVYGLISRHGNHCVCIISSRVCVFCAAVFDTALNGDTVFFTGKAGTGKSYLLQKVIAALPSKGTVVTASTGVVRIYAHTCRSHKHKHKHACKHGMLMHMCARMYTGCVQHKWHHAAFVCWVQGGQWKAATTDHTMAQRKAFGDR